MRRKALLMTLAIVCGSAAARGDEGAGPVSPCFDTRDVDLCIRFVADIDDRQQQRAETAERLDCERRLVLAGGEGVFTCASDRPGARAGADVGAGLGAKLALAVRARRRREADDIYRQILSFARDVGASECTAACNADGRTLLRVSRDATSLVRGDRDGSPRRGRCLLHSDLSSGRGGPRPARASTVLGNRDGSGRSAQFSRVEVSP